MHRNTVTIHGIKYRAEKAVIKRSCIGCDLYAYPESVGGLYCDKAPCTPSIRIDEQYVIYKIVES